MVTVFFLLCHFALCCKCQCGLLLAHPGRRSVGTWSWESKSSLEAWNVTGGHRNTTWSTTAPSSSSPPLVSLSPRFHPKNTGPFNESWCAVKRYTRPKCFPDTHSVAALYATGRSWELPMKFHSLININGILIIFLGQAQQTMLCWNNFESLRKLEPVGTHSQLDLPLSSRPYSLTYFIITNNSVPESKTSHLR